MFNVERNLSIGKKTEDGQNLHFKALANRFLLPSKSYSLFNKVVHGRPSINGLHEKVNNLLLKVD